MKQKLFMIRSKLTTIIKSFEKISMRRKLIFEFKIQTKSYSIAQHNASSRNILLRWILQQISLIEIELNSVKIIKKNSTQRNDKRQRSLKRNRIDGRNEESVSKRRRQDDENFMLSESKSRIFIISKTFSIQQLKRSSRSYINLNISASYFYSQRVLRALRLSNTKSDSASTLLSDSYSQRALRALRSSTRKSDSARSVVILNDSTQTTKNRRSQDKSFDDTLDSRLLRRSSRLKRSSDRFQWGSKDLSGRKTALFETETDWRRIDEAS
jgi:hypothetical protein